MYKVLFTNIEYFVSECTLTKKPVGVLGADINQEIRKLRLLYTFKVSIDLQLKRKEIELHMHIFLFIVTCPGARFICVTIEIQG